MKNPRYNAVGTYYYDKKVIIFASLKKDASTEERLNYIKLTLQMCKEYINAIDI